MVTLQILNLHAGADMRQAYFVALPEEKSFEKSVLQHAEMHRLGDFYDIPRLRRYACSQILEDLDCITWSSENAKEFAELAKAVYGSSLKQYCSLRRSIVQAFTNHPFTVAEETGALWKSLVRESPRLPTDALRASYRNRSAKRRRCWHVRGHKCL